MTATTAIIMLNTTTTTATTVIIPQHNKRPDGAPEGKQTSTPSRRALSSRPAANASPSSSSTSVSPVAMPVAT